MSTSLLISTFSPFPTLSLSVPDTTSLLDIQQLLREKYPSLPSEGLALTLPRGLTTDVPVSTLGEGEGGLVSLRLTPRILGGKGGFGSQLRAAGGRMSSQKTNNNDSCRDLSGRRLSTIKEAKKLAEYLESEPERIAAKAEAQKVKLEALERRLGIQPASGSGSGSGSGSSSDAVPILAGKKHRLEDTEYLEQSQELIDGVKSAVSAALLKKRKKAKTEKASADDKGKGKGKATASVSEAKVSAPKTEKAPVASVEAVGA